MNASRDVVFVPPDFGGFGVARGCFQEHAAPQHTSKSNTIALAVRPLRPARGRAGAAGADPHPRDCRRASGTDSRPARGRAGCVAYRKLDAPGRRAAA